MKAKYVTTLITGIMVVLWAGVAFSQPPDTLWTNNYGGWLHEYFYDVRSTGDGGFIAVGLTNTSTPYSYYYVYLVKTNADGDMLWSKTHGHQYSDRGYSIQVTADGGYIITGSSEVHTGAGGLDVYLIRTDSEGDTLWTRTYGGSQSDEGETVVITPDQGYMIAGYTNSYGAGDKDFYLIRTDSNGDTLWTRAYGGAGDDLAWSVAVTPDSGFIVTGRTKSFGAGSWDVWLLRTDAAGDTLWSRTYGGYGWDSGLGVQSTVDGGFIVNGYTMSFGAGDTDYYMLKTDSSGNILWSRTYGGYHYDNGTCVRQLPDGGYLLGGYAKSFGDEDGDFWIIRTDVNGDSLWSQLYGGPGIENLNGMDITLDGGYILAGKTTSVGAYNEAWLVRIASDVTGIGFSEQALEIPIGLVLSPVTPNPVSSNLVFDLHTEISGPADISIYDISGRIAAVIHRGLLTQGTHSFLWVVSETISNGIYIIKASCGDFTATSRMTIIR